MDKQVILQIGEGSFEDGFRVTLTIGEWGKIYEQQLIAELPPNPKIAEYYNNWSQNCFPKNSQAAPSLKLKKYKKNLINSLNNWLKSSEFLDKWFDLLGDCRRSDRLQLILQTDEEILHQLPWCLWDFFDKYPQAEIAIGSLQYKQVCPQKLTETKVKILGIFGDCEGIDTEQDREFLEGLKGIEERNFLLEPKLKDISDRLWKQSWDLLFFAGHSKTEEGRGKIFINSEESLEVDDLKNGLKEAIARGLRIAIFNSCDGLGLARSLADLNLPQIIVMREPVPDKVAQEFLKYFLEAFSGGESFYLAVRKARKQLEGLEDKFPCASWLPVIFQNTADLPPTWDSLRGGKSNLVSQVFEKKMPGKGETNKVAAGLTIDEIYEQKIDPEKELYPAFFKLDYEEQTKLFKDLLWRQNRGCFLIQGREDCGPNFLLTRLIEQIPRSVHRKIIPVNLARTNSVSRESLLREIGREVGVKKDCSPERVARGIYQLWQSRHGIIIFYSVHLLPSESLQAIMDFWSCLDAEFQELPTGDYNLLMFLLDYGGKLELPNLPCADKLDGNWLPKTIVRSPLLPERFTEVMLTNWFRDVVDILPRTVIKKLQSNLQSILENSDAGVPKYVLQEICELCDCEWDKIRRRLHS